MGPLLIIRIVRIRGKSGIIEINSFYSTAIGNEGVERNFYNITVGIPQIVQC